LIRVPTALFRALEGVDGRDMPGQDEIRGPIFPVSGRKIFPGQPCAQPGIQAIPPPVAPCASQVRALAPAFAGATACASRPHGEAGCFRCFLQRLSASDISSSA